MMSIDHSVQSQEEPDIAQSKVWSIMWQGVGGILVFTKNCCVVREVCKVYSHGTGSSYFSNFFN
jgi:hypothetical protein